MLIPGDKYETVFSWQSMVSSDTPVFTLPILSPNARSSCENHDLRYVSVTWLVLNLEKEGIFQSNLKNTHN